LTLHGAVRVDKRSGIEERVLFFGPESAPLFGCLHAPLEPALATVVMCPSIDADFTMNYRRQVLLARFLAAAGIAVQRFHYRGTGNSFGDPAETTFETLRDDALSAAELALSDTASDSLAFLGAGWGALVAASAVHRFPSAPLILWEPVTEPARYYRNALLAWKSRQIVQPDGSSPSTGNLLDELPTRGSIDVFGYVLHSRLYQTSYGRSLVGELGQRPRRILLIQPEETDGPREHRRPLSALKEQGFALDLATAGKPAVVWFRGRRDPDPEEAARPVAKCIHAWLSAGVTGE
jgi:alpha/beta superfamily hydrolase